MIYIYKKDDNNLSVCYTMDDIYVCVIHNLDMENNIAYYMNVEKIYFTIIFNNGVISIIDKLDDEVDYSGAYRKESGLTMKELENLKYPIF